MKLPNFRRIISQGKFIPEIDGLRFIAISSVLLYHVHIFLREKNVLGHPIPQDFDFTPNFIINGNLGVELFFVISGFILAKLFAQAYIFDKKIQHKTYFVRRLTRLEPPYILTLILLFIGSVFVAKNLDFQEATKSLLASIFYVHNFIYPESYPKLLTVAWSLEVEVQFYILAPLLGLLFKVKNKSIRRSLIIGILLLFTFLPSFFPAPFTSLYDYLPYFLVGMILSDIYVSDKEKIKMHQIPSALKWIICLAAIYFYYQLNQELTQMPKMIQMLGQLGLLFLLFYLVLFQNGLPFLKNKLITYIGGACYTIYLLHYPIISMFGNQIVKLKLTEDRWIENVSLGLILIFIVLIISAIFFLLIERPCMKKDWHKNLFAKKNS